MKKAVFVIVLCLVTAIAINAIYRLFTQPPESNEAMARPIESMAMVQIAPGENFTPTMQAYGHKTYRIIGQDTTGMWWQIEVSDQIGWIEASQVTVVNVENVPVIETTPCRNAMSPRCPAHQEIVTVRVRFFEEGVSLQMSNYRLVISLPYYDEQMPYGYLSTYPNIGEAPQSQANLDSYRPDLGEETEASVSYTTTLERYTGTLSPHDDLTYLRLPDERVVSFDILSGHWSFVE